MANVSYLADIVAFPKLTAADLAQLKPLATPCSFKNGETVFRAGDPDVDLFVVESGEVAILNPADGAVIVTHGPGQFSGDIDLLTRRPVLVNGRARGPASCIRICGD